MPSTSLPRIAITMGDPAGIGPEICLRFLASRAYKNRCIPLIFGDAGVLRRASEQFQLGLPATIVPAHDDHGWQHLQEAALVDCDAIAADLVEAGQVSALTGRAAYEYVTRAIDAAVAGKVAAITTGPINKEALSAAGIRFAGHTEILIDRTQPARSCMMLTSDELTCSLVTAHVSYADVPRLLTPSRIVDVIELSAAAMRLIRDREPQVAVCGLNPHAGEHGLFGNGEEEECIVPAIEIARSRGIQIEGPLPPDTAFLPARRARTDVYICMYHDQALIPLKTLAFDTAVNVTLGLPIVRTSVDHGTAFDIAWQGIARYTSLSEAVKLAVRLIQNLLSQ